jgi:hypothetical protein
MVGLLKASSRSPREWRRANFEKNQAFFEDRPLSTLDWNAKRDRDYGSLCLTAVEYVVTAFAVNRVDLSRAFLEDALRVIEESDRRTREDVVIDLVGLNRVEVALASRTQKVLDDKGIDRTPITPYEAFQTYLSSPTDIEPEDFDCVWLMWGLSAALEDERARYEELMTKVRRKSHRELVRERELLCKLSALFDGSADESFWSLYSEVLRRWLDPVLETESEASLYREAIRYLLALNWMVYRLGSERRDDFLEVLYGNI